MYVGCVMQGWTIMMMLPRKPPPLAEKGRYEIVEDLALLAAPGGRVPEREL